MHPGGSAVPEYHHTNSLNLYGNFNSGLTEPRVHHPTDSLLKNRNSNGGCARPVLSDNEMIRCPAAVMSHDLTSWCMHIFSSFKLARAATICKTI